MKILLTGASGFLGSHIAELLCKSGHELLLVKRHSSDLWRCQTFVDKVKWVNIDSDSFEDDAISFSPEVVINSAWNGVSSKDRDNWGEQIENLFCLQRLLNIAKQSGAKKFIGVGSQAEYGVYNGYVDENSPVNPVSAYSAAKHSSQIIIKAFCEENRITWYWFRLFSCFGERECENWLIPVTIKNMMFNQSMDLTSGEQQYSYLYIKDVAYFFLTALESNSKSGIYNIASDSPISIKKIILLIRDYLNPNFTLNFGAIPYRKNQSMLNGAVNKKAKDSFGPIYFSDFSEKLIQTIEYYKGIYDKR